jgi:hypothetical protein
MASSGCGRPAGTLSGGWGCRPRLPRTALLPSSPAGRNGIRHDLTLPKLRARWTGPAGEGLGQTAHGVMARDVLRGRVTAAAAQARNEAGFFAQLRESGVLVRLRYSEVNPCEVTGYVSADVRVDDGGVHERGTLDR